MHTLTVDAQLASQLPSVAARRVALIGAGTMGRAIAGGLQRAGVFPDAELRVADRHDAAASALAAEVEGAVVSDVV